jgi:hypothetical protein
VKFAAIQAVRTGDSSVYTPAAQQRHVKARHGSAGKAEPK